MGKYTFKRTIIGHIEKGADLYNTIARIIQENQVRIGRVTGMGAVQRAKLAYYDQKGLEYREISFNEPMEIVSLYGNISIKDGKPFAHIHVSLSDERGRAHGGHLLPDHTPVFACEVFIEEFDGKELVRKADDESGLALWGKETRL